ncbi:MAG: hypothetical protein ACM3WV_06970 [Bacillota bacterium]
MAEFTDLVLLVGTNPLPNYVVARYFLDNNEKLQYIWLIHSEENKALEQNGTLKFANYIRDRIPDAQERFRFVALSDVNSAQQIGKDLSKKMCSRISRDAKLHLNYTGGTKAMSVHVYQKLKEQFKERISFSYLDARSFRLIEDDQENLSGDLRKKVYINMEELFKLHGYKRKLENDTDPEMHYTKAFQKIKWLINQENLDVLLKWQKEFARKLFYDDKGLIEETRKFLKNLQQLIMNDQINKVEVDTFREKFKVVTPPEVIEILKILPSPNIIDENNGLWMPSQDTTNREFKKRVKGVIEFLDGKWLEHYVFEVLNESIYQDPVLKSEYNRGWISLEHNWKIEKEDTKDFEVDVILLYGYQLCGVSCTTSQRENECKLKGFEIIHRMRQIGGDEAGMVLVTCLSDEKKDQFWQDLLTSTGSKRKNFLVLTKGDLNRLSLWTKIRQHIWGD